MQILKIEERGKEQSDSIKRAITKMGLVWTLKNKIFEVMIEDPMDAYYLGANVVAESIELFKGPLTK